MSKLRFVLLLPFLQFVIAVSLLGLGQTAMPPRGPDTLYVPITAMICTGITAPAILFKLPLHWVPVYYWPNVGKFSAGDLLFLVGVVVVWAMVGRIIDARLLRSNQAIRPRLGPRRTVFAVLMLLLGLLLFYMGIVPLQNSPGSVSGGIAEAILFFVWGGILTLVNIVRLLRSIYGTYNWHRVRVQ